MRLKTLAAALLVGAAALPAIGTGQARADVAQEVTRSVIQSVLQNIRDQIYRRRLVVPGRISRFAPDRTSQYGEVYDNAFGALALAADMPVKAPPLVAVGPSWMWGAFGDTGGDWDRAAGITTRAFHVAGGINVTRIGFLTSDDALTVIGTGVGTHARSPIDTSNSVTGTGTVAYQRGAFSSDTSFTEQSTRSDTTGVRSWTETWASNYQYRFGGDTFFEPTAGYSVSRAHTPGVVVTRTWEVQGGARVGTQWTASNGVVVQPSVTVLAFSPVSIQGPVGADALQGHVGVRASGKLNFVLSQQASVYVEGSGRAIQNTSGAGVKGGFTLTFSP